MAQEYDLLLSKVDRQIKYTNKKDIPKLFKDIPWEFLGNYRYRNKTNTKI